ncbi:guanylate kinase [Clostridium celatum]|nr:guanylate kinase [Clostridium celatum]MCE9656810.1 guanylate kinase [Clostridium celatum]MDU2266530.1 guanylate kinase [Clostridium celatum]MDU6296870.1 guanylate kinase [Clostridium celatum]
MGKIFCLMGKSNSGKDTIFKELMKDKDLNLMPIVSYTTRPIRSNETNGVEYYFINEDILNEYRENGKIIEERKYDTVNGPWYYCTIDDNQINLEVNNYLLIVTLEAYKNIKMHFGEENVCPFYIELDDGVRLERALKREKEQQNSNYDELCRRFLADNNDFSFDKLKSCNIEKFYVNDILQECVNNIKSDILNLIN